MTPYPVPAARRVPWAWLVAAAALLAHGGCLGATFYLDDWTQIVDCDLVDQGTWYTARLRALTYGTYFLTYRLAGMSSAAFHAGNLLLHAGVALALLGFAREFLAGAAGLPPERARRVGGWAALIFAVHPLCSEMPDYARARDIGLVSLFSLLAAWGALRWRRDGGWRPALGMLAAVAAATFSKEVGVVLAVGAAALIALAVPRRRPADAASPRPRRRWGTALALAGAAVLLSVGLATGIFALLWQAFTASLRTPRLGWHVLTEARVFWMYLARVAWPAGLCSDHQIAWTVSARDATAWVSLAGETLLAAAALAAMCWRGRPAVRAVGALGAVAFLDIAHRLANVSSELMVEYRMYPAMLPICLLLAWGLDTLRQRAETRWSLPPFAVPAALAALVAAGGVRSACRTLDWRSPDALVANILSQYPLHARARQELQEDDIRAGRWAAVVERQAGIRQACDAIAAFDRSRSVRRYDNDLADLTRISSEGNYAFGLAKLGRRAEAFAHLTWLHAAMDANHVSYPFLWSNYYYASALVHAAVGQREDALEDLRDSVSLDQGLGYTKRQLRRYEEGAPLP